LSVVAKSADALTNVKLNVHDPTGALVGRTAVTVGRDGSDYMWSWTTDPLALQGDHVVAVTTSATNATVTVMVGDPQATIHSKLGPHIIKDEHAGYLLAGPAVAKYVGEWGSAVHYALANTLVIGRLHSEAYDAQWHVAQGMSPQQAAEMFVPDQLGTYMSNEHILYWEGHNEPIWNTAEEMAWYAEFEIARMQLMANIGLRCVIGNFATGTPALSLWPAFLPAIEAGLEHKAILGLHEYSCPWMWWMTGSYQLDPADDQGDEGWTTLRYRKAYRQHLIPAGLGHIPLAITEAGIDSLVRPLPPGAPGAAWSDLGDYWRDHDREPDAADYYFQQLVWYDQELQNDEYVVGATVFCFGNYGAPWSAFDVAGTAVADKLTAYAQAYPGKPFVYPTDKVSGRGDPRTPYKRTYVLLPPGADKDWAVAAIEGSWRQGQTVGGSADDAGIGDLPDKTARVINPAEWTNGDIANFYGTHYPNTGIEPLVANTPAELKAALQGQATAEYPWHRDVTAALPQRTDYEAWSGTSLENGWGTRTLAEIDDICIHHTAGLAEAIGADVGASDFYNLVHWYVWSKTWTSDLHTYTGHPSGPYSIVIDTVGTVLLANDLTVACWHNQRGASLSLSIGLLCDAVNGLPTEAQLDALAGVCVWAIQSDVLPTITSIDQITGHLDWFATECPGWTDSAGHDRWKRALLEKISVQLGEPLPGNGPTPTTASPVLGIHDWPGNAEGGSAIRWLADQGLAGTVYVPLYVGTGVSGLNLQGYADQGFKIYYNLRFSYSTDKGGAGTLPPENELDDFVEACLGTMRASTGIAGYAIGNEWNNPRESPKNFDLSPTYVAAVYNEIWRRKPEGARVSLGAVDPFFGPGSDCGWWFDEVMKQVEGMDFIDLHGYVRGPNAGLVWSMEMFGDDPLRWQYLNYFGCVETMLRRLPARFHDLPVIVSEFNHLWKTSEEVGDLGWVDDERATAVLHNAIARALEWNEAGGHNPIEAVIAYRWSGDEWAIDGRGTIKAYLADLLRE